jgi:hypothetical protein
VPTARPGTERTIVHNDSHTDGRVNSNITHEAAHGLLLHPPTPALDDRGCRMWDRGIEDCPLAADLLSRRVAPAERCRQVDTTRAAAGQKVGDHFGRFRDGARVHRELLGEFMGERCQ